MNIKRNTTQDWLELAKQANWSVSKLANLCGISPDTLRRHFLAVTGKSARQWLIEERQQQALLLLDDGSSAKEAASMLGYKQQTNFTRSFKYHWGFCPSRRNVLRPNAGK